MYKFLFLVMFVQVVKAQTLCLSVFLNGLRLKFCLYAPCEDFYIPTRLLVSDFHCQVNQWMGESSSGFGSKSLFFPSLFRSSSRKVSLGRLR